MTNKITKPAEKYRAFAPIDFFLQHHKPISILYAT